MSFEENNMMFTEILKNLDSIQSEEETYSIQDTREFLLRFHSCHHK